MKLDHIDKAIINRLQYGFPITERPYQQAAAELGLTEEELIQRLQHLLEQGMLSRFGPMYHAEKMGGALSLCAMAVPKADFERVAEQVNAFAEVAHNYQRDHHFNLWFVIAAESEARKQAVLAEISASTGYKVYDFPKQKEFYIGLYFQLKD